MQLAWAYGLEERMTAKRVAATRNPRTGSYTVRVPKSATTGKFVSEAKTQGRIEVKGQTKRTS